MRRLLILLALIFIPWTSWAQCTEEAPCQELARLGPWMGGGVPAEGGDPCGCVTSTYMFCYTGDYSGDTDKACFSSNSVAAKDASIKTATVSADYVYCEGANKSINWPVNTTTKDGISDVQGTIFLSFELIDADSDSDVEAAVLFEGYYDANNTIYITVNASANTVVGYHKGQGTSKSANCSANNYLTYTEGTTGWHRVGFTWKATADGTGDSEIKCSIVALGNDPSWYTPTSGVKTVTEGSEIDLIGLGENESSGATTDHPKIADVIILSGYAADDPRQ